MNLILKKYIVYLYKKCHYQNNVYTQTKSILRMQEIFKVQSLLKTELNTM